MVRGATNAKDYLRSIARQLGSYLVSAQERCTTKCSQVMGIGILERQNGTKDPYWFNPGIDHQAKGVERQRILCGQALAAVASRLEKIMEYVAAPGVLSTRERAQLAEFVEASSAAIAKVRFVSTNSKSSNT